MSVVCSIDVKSERVRSGKVVIMSQYKASIPSDGQVKPEIRDFFEKFYQISDDPEAHEKYSEQYTKDAKLIMGPAETNGRSG